MFIELPNTCIFEPESNYPQEIRDMQDSLGDEITAFISKETKEKFDKVFGGLMKEHDVIPDAHFPEITRYENTKGVVDFIVII